MARGDYSAAEATYRNSLQEMARTLGSEHAELGTLWRSLGAVQDHQEQYVDAEALEPASLGHLARGIHPRARVRGKRPQIEPGRKSGRANSLQGVERNAPRGNWNCPANAKDRIIPTVVPGLTYLARTALAMGQQDEAERVAREKPRPSP